MAIHGMKFMYKHIHNVSHDWYNKQRSYKALPINSLTDSVVTKVCGNQS